MRLLNYSPLKKIDLFLYFFLILFCFLSFNHPDLHLIISETSSLFDGPLFSFYDRLKDKAGILPAYPPSIYFIFGLWSLPLKAVGVLTGFTHVSEVGFLFFWYKLLTTLFSIATAILIYKIAFYCSKNTEYSSYSTWIWLSSPFFIFTQFVFGQIDIFPLFFALIGFYYFQKNSLFLFSLFFGLTLTFKGFPLFLFIPLLLLKEKRVLHCLLYLGVLLLPYQLEKLLFSNSPAFLESTKSLTTLGLFRIQGLVFEISNFQHTAIFPAIWTFICGWAYTLELKNHEEHYKYSLFIGLTVFTLFFILVDCHPQWFIYFTPFFALLVLFYIKPQLLFQLEILLTLTFIFVVYTKYPQNVDLNLMASGIWAQFNPTVWDERLMPWILNQAHRPLTVWVLDTIPFKSVPGKSASGVLMGIILLYIWCLSPASLRPTPLSILNKESFLKFWRLRFYIGVLILVFPLLSAYLKTLSIN